MKNFQFVIQDFLRDHEKHKKYIALLTVLSIVVSFAVPLSLIMPAISMSGELQCGMEEHIHSDECYELICDLDETEEHSHNAECYALICDIPEHIHSQECYSDYEEEFYEEDNFENLSPDAVNISNVMEKDENGNELVCNIANADGNSGYSKQSLTEVQLLIGDLSSNPDENLAYIVNGSKSAADVITKARNKYFLGIASDFCVFLEGDFTPKKSDTEGRVAVGGNISADENYQIGAGDFGNKKVLDQTADYYNRKNFAHIIMGGSSLQNVAPFGTKNEGAEMIAAKGTEAEKEQNAYKRFVVPTNFELSSTSHTADSGNVSYNNNCTHWGTAGNGATLNEESQFYKSSLINFSSEFEFIRSQSEKLKNKGGKSVTISEDGNTITFDAGTGCTDETVYFELDASTIGNLDGKTFNFTNIPEFNGTVYSEVSSDKNVETSFPKIANIVINVKGTNIQIGDDAHQVHTYINNKQVSNIGDQQKWSNNHPYSENLLYNFYEANTVYLNANFNGTVLAPNADVTSNSANCEGHLSGSLIAKSFEGGLEFGYRPYRGTNNILGSQMGYTIPVDKFLTNTETRVEGATFNITCGNDVITSFTSLKDDTNYVDIPSGVDFTGDTDYTTNQVIEKTYNITEISAPDGYIKTDTSKSVTIKETINTISTLNDKQIPTKVTAEVKFDNNESFTIVLEDTYSYEGGTYKQIRRTLTMNNETFFLEIQDGNVQEVSKQEGEPIVTAGSAVSVVNTNAETVTEVMTSTSWVVTDKDGSDVVESKNTIITNPPIPSYTISQIAYGGSTAPSGNISVTFYYIAGSANGTSKTFEITPNSSAGEDAWHNGWYSFNIGSDVPKTDVVGISISSEDTNFIVQDGSWTTIESWQNSDGTFGVTDETDINNNTTEKETVTSWKVTEMKDVLTETVSYYTETAVSYYDKYQTITVSQRGDTYETTTITLDDSTTKQVPKYYYNPDSLMLMPLPAQIPTFENSPGLLFKKVDKDTNRELAGAKIVLESLTLSSDGNSSNVATPTYTVENADGTTSQIPILSWAKGSPNSSQTIDVSKLVDGTLYRFNESNPPSGYESAEPIYIVKKDNKIYYTNVTSTAANYSSTDENYAFNGWENVSLTPQNGTPATITMEDIRITGAKVKLGKYNANLTTPLDGATFKLYARQGNTDTLVYPNNESETFTIPEAGINLYDVFKNPENASKINADYVQNGYLSPGTYYLQEVSAPSGYDKADGFTFKVKSDSSIEAVDSGTPVYFGAKLENNDSTAVWVKALGSDGNTETTLSNVTKIEIDLERPTTSGGYICIYDNNTVRDNSKKDSNVSITSDTYGIKVKVSGTSNTATIEFENGISFDKMKVQNFDYSSGCKIKEVRIYGEEAASGGTITDYTIGKIDVQGAGSSDKFDVTFYYNNGTSTTKTNLGVLQDTNTEGNPYYIDISSFGNDGKNNVIGVKVKALQAYTGRIVVQEGQGTWPTIFDSNWDSKTLAANEEITFGETSISSSSGETTPSTETEEETTSLNAVVDTTDPTLLKLPNEKAGLTIDITVKKEWPNDNNNAYSLRPDSITVQLKRQTYDSTTATYIDDETFNASTNTEYIKTLNAANSWQYEFEKLDKFIDLTKTNADGEVTEANNVYKYYVEETAVTPETNNYYTVSYPEEDNRYLSTSGTLTITNTLKTTNLTVNKQWKNKNNTNATENIPASIQVELQWKNSSGTYVPVEGLATNPITLTATDSWSYTFENLPKNKEYKVVESEVTGWAMDTDNSTAEINTANSTSNNNTFTIVNKPVVGALNIVKEWKNDEDDTTNRLNSVTVDIYRSTISPSGSIAANSILSAINVNNISESYPNYNDTSYTPTNDYARLLQYSLYFYDANMCGNSVTTDSAYTWRTNCHTDDGDYSGGFHDAGDYVMFGLPQGFTASTLGWSLYEYKKEYDDLGLTSHIQMILNHFNDFFKKAIQTDEDGNITSILYQKGNGTTDHNYYGMPENQSSRSDQLYWTDSTTGGSEIAAEYAASLALQYLNFGDTNALNLAKKLYAYSESLNKATSGQNNGFYPNSGTNTYKDDQAWAAAWLSIACTKAGETANADKYKTDCQSFITEAGNEDSGNTPNGYSAHQWNNVLPATKVVNASYLGGSWNDITNSTNGVLKDCTGTSFMNCNDWGNLRYNLGYQLIALVSYKHNNNIDYRNWCQNQMNYILGDNEIESNGKSSTCFVTGFANNSAKNVHYRPIYDFNNNSLNDNLTAARTLVGALVGGPDMSGNYSDISSSYQYNEVALDYNANLVMAAAGLYSVYGTGAIYSNDSGSGTSVNSLDTSLNGGNTSVVGDAETENTNAPAFQNLLSNVNNVGDTLNHSMSNAYNPSVGIAAGSTVTLTFSGSANTFLKGCIGGNLSGSSGWKQYEISGTSNLEGNITITQVVDVALNGDQYLKVELWEGKDSFNLTGYSVAAPSTEPTTPTTLTSYNVNSLVWNDTNKNADINITKVVITYANGNTKEITTGLTFTEQGNDGNWFQYSLSETDRSNIVKIQVTTSGTTGTKRKFVIQQYGNNWGTIMSSGVDIEANKTYEFDSSGYREVDSTDFTITPSETSIEESGNATLTANKAATWSVKDGSTDKVQLTSSSDGKSCTVTPLNAFYGDVVIQAVDSSDNTVTVEATVSITAVTPTYETIRVRPNGTADIVITPNTGTITYGNVADTSIATISGSTITGVSAGSTTVSVTRNGVTVNVPIEVVSGMTINEGTTVEGETGKVLTMSLNSEQTLTLVGAIGDVTWSSSDESVLTVENGVVTSHGEGTATITATDSDGTTATIEITVRATAQTVELPAGAERIQTVQLNANGNWDETVENLPLYDANGSRYYYYIKENDVSGYIPVSYSGNGSALVQDGTKTLKVTNYKSDENAGATMPSAGGEGTRSYQAVGIALVGGALITLGIRKRRKHC